MKVLFGMLIWKFISPLFQYNTALNIMAFVIMFFVAIFLVSFIFQWLKGGNGER